VHYPSNIDIFANTLNELAMTIGLQQVIENILHTSLGPSLNMLIEQISWNLFLHPIVTIQNVPSINQFYESLQDVTKAKKEFHKLVLKEANGLVVVAWPNLNMLSILMHLDIFTC
jgi:hypothetical protein